MLRHRVPPEDNYFAAVNSAVWSGGSFVYVPEGVHVDVPLQAYFLLNAQNIGQFERTLIIGAPGSKFHYIEGCTAPAYTTNSFHSGVIEIIAQEGSDVRYSTIQNWSHNVYNLVTQRAIVEKDASMGWLDGNLGSKVTMKYPSTYLVGERAHGEILSIAFATDGQHQDAGAKVIHAAPHTTSSVVSKSISKTGGRSSYRGLVQITRRHRRPPTWSATRCCSTRPRAPTPSLHRDQREDRTWATRPRQQARRRADLLPHDPRSGEEKPWRSSCAASRPVAKELPLEYA